MKPILCRAVGIFRGLSGGEELLWRPHSAYYFIVEGATELGRKLLVGS